MHPSRSFIALTVAALVMSSLAPAAFAVRCDCDFCRPGNLLAQCTWPGHGTVYCVDFWEFQCAWGPGMTRAATGEASDETVACKAADTADDMHPDAPTTDDSGQDDDEQVSARSDNPKVKPAETP